MWTWRCVPFSVGPKRSGYTRVYRRIPKGKDQLPTIDFKAPTVGFRAHLGKLYHGHQRLGWLFQPTCNMFSPIRSAIGTFPQVEVKKHDLKPPLRLGEEANYHITTTIHYLLDSFESVMSKMTSTNEILHSEVLGFSLEVALQKFTGTTGTQASYSKLYNRSLCDIMCVCFKKWKEKHVIYISYQSHWASLNIPWLWISRDIFPSRHCLLLEQWHAKMSSCNHPNSSFSTLFLLRLQCGLGWTPNLFSVGPIVIVSKEERTTSFLSVIFLPFSI